MLLCYVLSCVARGRVARGVGDGRSKYSVTLRVFMQQARLGV